MKAVILAAGFGSRLNMSLPKCLVRFTNGKCLLDYQLAALSDVLPLHDITIIVGFKKDLIMAAAPKCTFLSNDRFAETNTAKSLLLALQQLDDDVLWMNGDVYAEPDVIKAVATAAGNTILVDKSRVADEEVCYTSDAEGNIAHLAKHIAHAEGEALGINKVQKNDVPTLARFLNEVSDKDYFERGIELGIERKLLTFRSTEAPGKFVKEMDFQADLDAIEAYLAGRT